MEVTDLPTTPQPAAPELEFWFDFASTYSYPAALRVEDLAVAHGVTVHWRAFLLGPIFQAQGWSDSPFNLYPAKGRYMWQDLQRLCHEHELEFHKPSHFPRNSVLAARIACAFDSAPWIGGFVRRVFTANFALDLDIADVEVITACLELLGQNPTVVMDTATSAESKAKLRARTEAADKLEIFGAPTFISDGELYWGNERLENALAKAAQASLGA